MDIVMFLAVSKLCFWYIKNIICNFRDKWVSLQRHEKTFNVCCPCQQLKTTAQFRVPDGRIFARADNRS